MYELFYDKNENHRPLHKFRHLRLAALMLLLIVLSGLGLGVQAQEPDYVVPVKTKRYRKVNNPLIQNTEPVDVTVVNGEVYFEGDISLGSEESLDFLQTVEGALIFNNGRWDSGIVPYVIASGFTAAEKNRIRSAMDHIAERTNVRFKQRTSQADYIKFKKFPVDGVDGLGFSGGSSRLGKVGGGQLIKLSSVSNRVVRHEIGHALGLLHEQNREDRNQHVRILWDNIDPDHKSQFKRRPEISTDVGNYDFNSIMHYRPFAFGIMVNGVRQQTILRLSDPSDTSFGSATVYSDGDVNGVNRMYPTMPGELAVGQSTGWVTISAAEPYNYTNIYLREDQKFEFSVRSPEWNNWWTVTTANGYNGGILDAARRHPDLKVMALVGEIFSSNNPISYTGTYFRIGTGRTWTATKSGKLVAFANDCLACYLDNSRVVELKAKRIE